MYHMSFDEKLKIAHETGFRLMTLKDITIIYEVQFRVDRLRRLKNSKKVESSHIVSLKLKEEFQFFGNLTR
jgi:hypothetical protein